MGRQLYRRRTCVGGLAAAAVTRLISAFHLRWFRWFELPPILIHLVPTRRATIGVAWLVIGVVTTLNLILIVLVAVGGWMRPELVEGRIPAALRQAQRA
jgi:hypothetical protein